MAQWVALGRLQEIGENDSKAFQLGDHALLACRVDDQVYVIENQCSHAFARLEGGRIRGGTIGCPLHGARFNLKTGVPLGSITRIAIRTFAARLNGDIVEVQLPCAVEPGAGA